MRIAVRADSSQAIGNGHIMRCLTLSDELGRLGHDVVYLCRDYSTSIIDLVKTRGFKVLLVEKPAALEQAGIPADEAAQIEDARSTLASLKQAPWAEADSAASRHLVELLIVDHYGLTGAYQQEVRPHVGLLMVIDDLAASAHHCDLLLDQTFGRTDTDYRDLVESDCKLLLGADYSLLRNDFRILRSRSARLKINVGKRQRIFISFGGVDQDNLTGRVLRWLIPQLGTDYRVDVLLGSNAAHLKDVETLLSEMDGYQLHVGVPDVARLMADADVAIGAAGTTSWERCCLGLPSLMVVMADNQQEVSRSLQAAGAALVAGRSESLSEEDLIALLDSLLSDDDLYRNMVLASLRICRGDGVSRVARQVTTLLSGETSEVSLRLVGKDDLDLVFEWQHEPGIRKYSRNSTPPSLEEHTAWFNQKILDPFSLFEIIEYKGQACGFVRLDPYGEIDGEYEVSILISGEYQGLGIGLKALQCTRAQNPDVKLYAYVDSRNIGSVKLFKKAGYVAVKDGYMENS